MRTIVRVGIITGGVGFVALFALQAVIALAVADCLLIVGLAAGLGTAKWLERPWFGRQLTAGLRGGVLAIGIAGTGALLSLFMIGPQDKTVLAARSHLLTLSMGPWVKSLTILTWAGIDILTVLLAGLAGIALSALTAQVFAWSKNRRAIQVVTQARQAAQAFSRVDPLAASSGSPSASQSSHYTGAPALGVGDTTGTLSALTGTPRPATAQAAPTSNTKAKIPAAPRRTLAPVPPTPPTGISGTQRAPLPRGKQVNDDYPSPTEPALPTATDPDEAPPSRRNTSKARPAGSQLTEAMRDALATWASDDVAEETPGERTGPQPSAYLNSSRPLPKRTRKKQNTRDWLC
jgi:type II secretory pathway pseudopilin PulG